jgi:hypothetical protein
MLLHVEFVCPPTSIPHRTIASPNGALSALKAEVTYLLTLEVLKHVFATFYWLKEDIRSDQTK